MPVSSEKTATLRSRFADLHQSGHFIMPNAWDIGSALILQSLGFDAIATTSSGFAASRGRHDQNVSFAELAVHVADICLALDIPLSVDAEGGYAVETESLERTVGQLAAAGASGVSIEDYLPDRGLLAIEEATERVGEFAEVARSEGVVVTARAENHLYGVDDLDDTIARLRSYREAGADVLYAPGLVDLGEIARLVVEVDAPVNVLLLPGGPSADELGAVGVRRLSTGGSLTFSAYGALAAAARELLEFGTSGFTAVTLSDEERRAAFGQESS